MLHVDRPGRILMVTEETQSDMVLALGQLCTGGPVPLAVLIIRTRRRVSNFPRQPLGVGREQRYRPFGGTAVGRQGISTLMAIRTG